jgi:hypothetical protein
LADGYRKRIEDRERPYEQGDEGKHEEGGGKEPEGFVYRAGLLVAQGLAADDFDAARERLGNGGLDRVLVGTMLGDYVYVVQLAALVQDLLRPREREDS